MKEIIDAIDCEIGRCKRKIVEVDKDVYALQKQREIYLDNIDMLVELRDKIVCDL